MRQKKHLENTLISIKAKNKVVTRNINVTKKSGGLNKKVQLTPRGQLHLETIYGSINQYVTKEEKINGSFTLERIQMVAKKSYREALLIRLEENEFDAKKAFTGKNSLDKNPIFLNEEKSIKVPDKVKIVSQEKIYTIRKDVSPDLKIDKVVDVKVRYLLEKRLKEYGGDAKKAFSNLQENPIWLNKEKGIAIKRVTITGISNAVSLHDKKDKDGKLILDNDGKKQAVDFVNTGNNHHVAIYQVPVLDKNGEYIFDEYNNQVYELQENVVSFFEATARVNQGLPIIDKNYNESYGWKFLFTMKQNEYFVFPNEETGFNPLEIDLLNLDNYALISPNLFRVQKFSKVMYGDSAVRDYVFRLHLETMINDNKVLKNITYKSIKSLKIFNSIVKIQIDNLGRITKIGEY